METNWLSSLSASFNKYYNSPTSILPLVTLRIIFGVMMLISTIRFWYLGWIEEHYIKPVFTFKYYGFEWVHALPSIGMYIVHVLMIFSAIGIVLGCFYRFSAILFFLLFTYCQLIDLTYYLNHYYFVSIISFLLIIVPAHHDFSIDIMLNRSKWSSHVPAWCINIFKLQIAIVYIYAGLAKINTTWLMKALPLKIWLPAQDKLPLIGWIFKYDWIPHLFSWSGMLYDTFIILFLLIPKTRFLAYLTVIFFHAMTGILFQIGVFPVVMIGMTIIFFSNEFHLKLLNYLGRNYSFLSEPLHYENKFLRYFIILFFAFQFIFPVRHVFYPGSMFWTEQGYRFGWRVMLMEKAGSATFYVKDNKTGREGEVFNAEFLSAHQEKQMAMQPDMILQYAHFLKKYYISKGMYDPSIRAEVYVTLNGQPSKLLIDPNIDLTKLKDTWSDKEWIINR